MKTTNQYDGCLDRWKVELALARMRAFRIPRHEWPDVLQRLVLVMLEFEFDPRRGVKESSALSRIINNRLASMVRSRERERDRMERYQAAVVHDGRLICEDDTAMRLDVRLALAELPETERLVCSYLMRGESVRQIAARLGKSWPTVRRIINRVRRRFEAVGLDAWVCEQ